MKNQPEKFLLILSDSQVYPPFFERMRDATFVVSNLMIQTEACEKDLAHPIQT